MPDVEINPHGSINEVPQTTSEDLHVQPHRPVGPAVLPIALDDSAWPIVHGDPASTDSTSQHQLQISRGLSFSTTVNVSDKDGGVAQMLLTAMLGARNAGGLRSIANQASALLGFSLADANPVSVITEKRPDGSTILWTSTIKNVIAYRQKPGSAMLEALDKFDHGYNLRFHGSYAFVGKVPGGNAGFFTTDDDALLRYELLGSDDRGWQILETANLALPKTINPDGTDHLVGVTVLQDGTIIVGSKNGVLMAARASSSGQLIMIDILPLAEHTRTSNSQVSNSISSSGQGVYVVTQREMVRADFDTQQGRLVFKWSTIYGPEEPWFVGRLGPGSGSTPTITQCQGRELVVITDGALPMNIVWYDTQNGNVAGQRKVQFASDEDGSLPITSEQSVAVDGCKAFVVQNFMGRAELDDRVYCNTAPDQSGIIRRSIPQICAQLVPSNSTDLFVSRACPAALGCYSFGVGVYEIQPQEAGVDGQSKVVRKWARTDKSCGTSIPMISRGRTGSNAVYCVGATSESPQWSLMGMDLDSGKDVLNFPFYKGYGAQNMFVNPFYAGVESIGEDQVVIGSVGGVVLVTGPPQGSPASAVSRLMTLSVGNVSNVHEGITGVMHGDLTSINSAGGATLLSAGALIVLLLGFLLYRSRIFVSSPRLPMRG